MVLSAHIYSLRRIMHNDPAFRRKFPSSLPILVGEGKERKDGYF
jgi:hypothetical protein